ncbi:DUF2946 domain-containing protein [Undibacterium sp. Jales W-56]|uniref:DUF2946 domain-containing protein n=1 Tax=Undibacterium sp. Jales W-56 TaxID=2897325 RepID=UPI0021D2BBF0|nr:DUF2946 domain-containing protein [Undibacterium sp. Jales W-56]MCU6433976.1 DUF2946 domain-containing protein [Undibacterium sp. Jales W-56]
MELRRISNRTNRKFITWLTVFALLMQAFMPSLSHAYMGTSIGKSAPGMAEICRSSGLQSLAPDQGSTPTVPAKTDHGEHCPYCFVGGSMAFPVALEAADFTIGNTNEIAIATPASNKKSALILAAAPRGPPYPLS